MKRTIFYNGKVYTANNGFEATAFVVENDSFAYVGLDEGAKEFACEGAELRDLAGARVIPGMMDTHCHYVALCLMNTKDMIDIDEFMTHEDVLEVVRKTAESHSVEEMPVINGWGYGTDCKPLASELDKAANDRPVYLIDSGGHAAWMNTKMIERAGLTADTPDPIPGVSYFARDEKGVPNGQVTETAVIIVEKKTGFIDTKYLVAQLPDMIKTMHSLGLVAAYDAGFLFMDEEEVLPALSNLDSALRFYTSFYYKGDKSSQVFLKKMMEMREKYSSTLLHPTTLKMFKDGTIEAETAWMFEDYFPPASGKGGEVLDNEKMYEMASLAAKEDFDIHVHAIGDQAISQTLDLFKDLGDISGTKTMAHVQVLPEDGVRRFAEQNEVFYQTTPMWLGKDEYTVDVLGEERALRQMPLKSMIDNKVRLTFGSDAPVSGGFVGMNPFNNIYTAVVRGYENDEVIPPKSEGIDVAACIDAYTIHGAEQVRAEAERGSIEVGKKADFVILDQDILAVEMTKISETTVVETWADGMCVYASQS